MHSILRVHETLMKKLAAQHLFPGVAILFSLGLLVGCKVPAFPETLEVVLPGDERQIATRGHGAEALANATFAAFRGPDPAKADAGPYGGLLDGGILERPPVDGQIFVADF